MHLLHLLSPAPPNVEGTKDVAQLLLPAPPTVGGYVGCSAAGATSITSSTKCRGHILAPPTVESHVERSADGAASPHKM